jgi:hypothetical protein
MKYIDFRTHLNEIMSGDKTVPADDKLKPIILQSLVQVAKQCEPLVLISDDIEDEILQVVEDGLFIRVPKTPNDDEDIIDMDETLVYAVSYLVASKISKNQTITKYTHEADRIINDYQWQRYRDIESGKFDYKVILTQNSLNIHGFKKIYISRTKTIAGYVYEWDMEFVAILGRYLAGEVLQLSKSDRINIDQYLEYQANGSSDNEMYEALDKFLGGING